MYRVGLIEKMNRILKEEAHVGWVVSASIYQVSILTHWRFSSRGLI